MSKPATVRIAKPTPLTLMEELDVQLEARLLSNDGKLFPLHQSIPPTPELVETLRQRMQLKRGR